MVSKDKILHIAEASARTDFSYFLSGQVTFESAKSLVANSLFLYFDANEEITQEDKDYFDAEFTKEWNILLSNNK